MEAPLVVEDREELVSLLSEAAQLEHMILCQYLFAAASLKEDRSEGLTAGQLAAVLRWERVVSGVAVQEMLHLALVSNLLTAIGAAPNFQRPNFPQQAKSFPPGVQLALLPFGEHALLHFLFLERQEGMERADAPEFAVPGPAAAAVTGREAVPVAQDFATIGHLYRGIEQGFRHLVARHGERRVFIGPRQAQCGPESFGWPELVCVENLATAAQAIETIIEEGEGARAHWERAHYGGFLRVYEEFMAFRRRPGAGRPAQPELAVGCPGYRGPRRATGFRRSGPRRHRPR